MPPVISAKNWPAAQPWAEPIAPGEAVKPNRLAMLTTPLFGSPAETGSPAQTVRPVAARRDTGCSDCGAAESACNCSGDRSSVPKDSLAPIALPSLGCSGHCGVVDCTGGCQPKRLNYFYEYLYMRTRNTDVAYAVPIDGPTGSAAGNGIQVGPAAVAGLDHEDQDGYRFGGSLLLNDGAQIGGRYTTFENSSNSQAFAETPDVLRSLITHPLGNNAAVDARRARADYEVEFEMADLFYQAHLFCNKRTTVDYVLGLRYAEINQRLDAQFLTAGVTSVNTDVEFYGFGPRVGLTLDHFIGCLGLTAYSRGDASFIPGTSRGIYRQTDSFAGTLVDTGWESGCIMTQLDFEVGLGWWLGDTLNITAGYLVSAWLNTPTTAEFIHAVQANDFNSIEGNGLTFDGLALRANLRF